MSNSQAGDALLCCLWGSRWPLPASSSLLEADSVQRPQPVPYRIFVSWSSGAGSKGAKFGGMQDVHFLLWKTDSRGGGSGSRCLGGGGGGRPAMGHFPTAPLVRGRRGEVPVQALTADIAIGASLYLACSRDLQETFPLRYSPPN